MRIVKGNIFASECQTLANTVNCAGVMGAGIALEYRLRYPEMYEEYRRRCAAQEIRIGDLWLYKARDRWILNVPTKRHWREPSSLEYVEAALRKFVAIYRELGIESVAFPVLGAQHGRLEPSTVLPLMESYLSQCDIPVEIYIFDGSAPDDLYEKFRDAFLASRPEEIGRLIGLSRKQVATIARALEDPRTRRLGQLAQLNGIGQTALERIFRYARSLHADGAHEQLRIDV